MKTMEMSVADGLTVLISPNMEHEFTMPTREVAKGYGVNIDTLRSHRRNLRDELIEGVHFISGVQILHGASAGSTRATLWTKAGVIRLGFFIKSERAKMFRDWAEKLVLMALSAPAPVAALPEAAKRKHNRLTPERLLDIMADVCLIQDKELRVRISKKLMGEI